MKKILFGLLTLSACGMQMKTTAPQAPMLQSVEKMSGALMVNWMNMTADCDSVEGERNADGGTWGPVFSVPGDVDNKHDTSANADVSYSYRLRCKKGADVSPYSNELSGNPVR